MTDLNGISSSAAEIPRADDSISKRTVAFSSAVANPSSALSVAGNAIDTGRYLITGSSGYTRPNDGIKANDGMVSILDKQTQSFVDVFGDPHVYTSDGDRAEFQKNDLQINLADGTIVRFKPTAQVNGYALIDNVTVSKGSQAFVESGFSMGGEGEHVSTSALASAPQGFSDPNTTVMTTMSGGGLNSLVNADGVQLSDKVHQTSLDGMGGATTPVSPKLIALMKELVLALQKQFTALGDLSGSGLSAEAAETGPAQSSALSTVTTSMEQLLGVLQSKVTAPSSPSSSDVAPASSDLGSSIQQLTTMLGDVLGQLQSGAPSSAPVVASGGDVATLVQQLVPMLQQMAASGTPVPVVPAPATINKAAAPTYDPSMGISGLEIQAMIDHVNGRGAAVNYEDWAGGTALGGLQLSSPATIYPSPVGKQTA